MSNYKLKASHESTTKIPRNFILLGAVETAGEYAYVSYGLIDDDDDRYRNNNVKLEHWYGSITYDDGKDLHILAFTFQCTKNFPKERPIVKFTKESLQCRQVQKICDGDGNITEEYLSKMVWSEDTKIAKYLTHIMDFF
jgi:ubiquitin-protein ligase